MPAPLSAPLSTFGPGARVSVAGYVGHVVGPSRDNSHVEIALVPESGAFVPAALRETVWLPRASRAVLAA